MRNNVKTVQSGKGCRVGESESRVGVHVAPRFLSLFISVYQLLSHATCCVPHSHNYSFCFLHLWEKPNTLNTAFPHSDAVLDGFGEP